MRKINTQDVFKLARIMKKGKVEETIANVIGDISNSKDKKISEKAGVKIMLALFESCGEAGVEELMYELFGGVAEIDPKEIPEQPFEKTIEMFKEIAKENDLANFFKSAGRLM